MAYDQSNSHQAPRRAYHDQYQQAPVQRQNGGYPPQQQYDNYDQSYDQGYGHSAQQNGGYDDYGYDVNQQPAQKHRNNGAGNGYGHEQYAQGYSQQDYGQQDYRQGGRQQQPNGYGRPNEAYANGHQEAYGSQDRQYDQRGQPRPGRGGHAQQPNGHGYAGDGYAGGQYQDPGMNDRQYDPRYQQRPDRGGQPPPNRSRSQGRPATSNSDYRGGPRSQPQQPPPNQDYRGQPPQPRGPDPRNAPPQPRPDHQGHPAEKNQQDPRNGHREQRDARDRPEQRPPPPQSNGGSYREQPPPQDPKKSAMEEWKAKEKAKLHEAANKPKMIPQDNAFPTFGNKKEGKDAGGREGRSTRSSEEQTRPSTSSGRSRSRPPTSKGSNQQHPSPPPAMTGQPQYDCRGPQNYAPVHDQPGQGHPNQYTQQRGDHGRDQQTNGVARRPLPPRTDSVPRSNGEPNTSSNNRVPPQAGGQQSYGQGQPNERQRVVSPPQAQAPYAQPQPPPQQTHAPVVEPARSNVPEPQPEPETTADSDEYYPQESWRTGPPRKRPLADRAPKATLKPAAEPVPKPQPQPVPQPVPQQEVQRTSPPTAYAQDQPRPRQPQAAPAPAVYLPQSQPPVAYQAPSRVLDPAAQQPRFGAQPAPKNFARPNPAPVAPAHEANPHDHYDDLYDDYYGAEQPQNTSVPMPPKNRDEEIEAEMPDFDSAAPGQTSGVHKRQQTVDKHLNGRPTEAPPQMPVMPSQHVNASVQSLPVQRHQPYEHHHEAAVASQPDFRDMRHDQGGAVGGFVFGVPGEQVHPQQQYDDSRQMQPRQQYDDPRQMQPRQQPMGNRPVQSVPPENMRRFESPVDQRQMNMPIHGGPPGDHPQGQRFHPGGRGPLPPQQRSASTRPPINQGGWSDPGMQRAPTAPPMGQDPYGAPSNGIPRNGSLMNQQHRVSSAPPGQQPMRGMPPPGAPRNGPPNGQQQPMRPPIQGQRLSDPDSLPHHPAPYRPGLMEQGAPQPPKPAPVRSYDNRSSTSSHQRPESISEGPITKASLEQARLDMEANKASPRLALRYAKKLVEASHVLASEGGRLDAKTTQRNREKYLNEAYKRVKELVRNTYPEAQFFMAECYGSGEMGLQIDPKEAFSLYQAAAKGGHAAAAFRTAVSCEIGPEEGGGTRKDLAKAVQWYRRAAALGDVAAMYKIGIVLLRGLLGVPRNVGEALSWLKRAAERADKDNPHALHELATLHEPTNPDPQVREKLIPDEAYALSLYKQAAEYGFKRSQFRLGQAYEYGSLGLDIDNRASIAWYTKAAAQGEHNAELALSGWYLTGAEGMLEQSDMEAYLWARKAAQSEPPLAKAMFAMGYFTEQGIGCPKSLEEAKRWYGRAASFQFPQAVARLEELRKGGKSRNVQQGKLTRDKKKDDENCVVM